MPAENLWYERVAEGIPCRKPIHELLRAPPQLLRMVIPVSSGMISPMKALLINPPSTLGKRRGKAEAPAPGITTGERAVTLKAFAAIHRSQRFTAASAHQAFAGVKRKK